MPKSKPRVIRVRGYPQRPDTPAVVHRLQFAPDGQTLAAWIGPVLTRSVKWPGTDEVCWIDVSSDKVTRRTGLLNDFGFDPSPFRDMAVSADLCVATLFTEDHWFTLDLHDSRRGETGNRKVTWDYEEMRGFCFDPTGRWLFAAGYRGSRMPARPDPAACEIVRCDSVHVFRTPRPKSMTRTVELPPNSGNFITVKGSPASNPWQVVLEIPDRKAEITALAVAPDGQSLAAASDQGAGWTFALPSGKRLTSFHQLTEVGRDQTVYRLAFSPDGGRLFALGRKGITCRPLSRSGKGWRSGRAIKAPHDFAFTPDGTGLLVTDQAGSITGLDVMNGGVRRVYSLGAGPLYGLAVSPSRQAAAGAIDGRIVLWNLEP